MTARRDFLGHPRGLFFLFGTEMWERFSFYGMYGLLQLYMLNYLFISTDVNAIFGFRSTKRVLENMFGPLDAQPLASHITGFYGGLVYLTPALGGFIADRWLGRSRTIISGAVLMAIGHFMMAFESQFLLALGLIILGSGAFKPNISTQVGELYSTEDDRRDRAFSIFYVGINLGAFLSPFVCGTLGERIGWHYGFTAAGVGMLIGLTTYLYGLRYFPSRARGNEKKSGPAKPQEDERHEGWRAVGALLTVGALQTLFWTTYEQWGITIVLWVEQFTDRSINLFGWTWEIPTTWFLSLNPLMIFALTPLIVALWARQYRRNKEPSTAGKMAFGCLCGATAYLILAAAAWDMGAGNKASWLWVFGYFLAITIGELYVSPIGLALVSKVSPPSISSLMMGLWMSMGFASNIAAGWLGSLWTVADKSHFFLILAAIAAVSGVAIWIVSGRLRPILER